MNKSKVPRFFMAHGVYNSFTIADIYHIDVRPLRLKLLLKQTTPEHPAKTWHSFYPIQQMRISTRVLISLHRMQHNIK